jgi:hypothetical protein
MQIMKHVVMQFLRAFRYLYDADVHTYIQTKVKQCRDGGGQLPGSAEWSQECLYI